MDGQQYSTAAIDELMSVVRRVQQQAKAQAEMPLVVCVHFAFAGLACAAFAASVLAKVAGLSTGDEYTDKFGFSCITSIMFFAVGSLMIERKRGELAGGVIGRALVACGLWVMSAQSYEFMQKAKSCEIQQDLLAKRKATPVSDVQFVALRSMQCKNGMVIEWEPCDDGTTRPVSVARGCSWASRDRVQSGIADANGQGGGVDSMPRGTSGITTGTNGDAATF